MKKINSKIFYSSSKSNSKSCNVLEPPVSIFRQELVTWENTKNGIKRTTIVRSFNNNKHVDNYISEPFTFKSSDV